MDHQIPAKPDTKEFLELLHDDPMERLTQLTAEIDRIPLEELADKGVEALANDNTLYALLCFEKMNTEGNPSLSSGLAYCLAKERGEFIRAEYICRQAMGADPSNSVHYLYMGRIFLLQGKKKEAIRIYEEGLQHEDNPRIRADLRALGERQRPVFPHLKRDNFLNKSLGMLLQKSKLHEK